MGWLFGLVIGLPILGCGIELFSWNLLRAYRKAQGVIHGGVVVLLCGSAVASLVLLMQIVTTGQTVSFQGGLWWDLTFLQVYWAFFLDSLAVLFIGVSTTLAALVCLYVQGTIQSHETLCRFMMYVCLGVSVTLLLVSSAHLLQVFIFWALLGFIVSLFVGFIYENKEAQRASLCVFIINRLGDLAFFLALWGCYTLFKDFEMEGIVNFIPHYADQSFSVLDVEVLTLPFIACSLGIACLIKSSQLGFHLGLYQAIEAPLCACALIFTLFTVGVSVYLVCRLSLLFDHVEWVRTFFLGVGLVTSLFMAMVASVKHNIKRILACAAGSQVGYIYIALGLSGYGVALFHWVTYVVFQTLLFFGAASVMRALSQEANIRWMGGIKNKIPLTYTFMGIGCFSLVGVPFFSGFFSKITIFELALGSSSILGNVTLGTGALSLFLTAYYALRLMWVVFHGSVRANEQVMAHIQESPMVMVGPMGVLASGSILGGYLSYGLFIDNDYGFWGSSLYLGKQEMALALASTYAAASPWLIWMGGILLFSFGVFFALHLYGRFSFLSRKLATTAPELYSFINESGYARWIYETLVAGPLWKLSTFMNGTDHAPQGRALYFLDGVSAVRKISLKIHRIHTLYFSNSMHLILIAGVLVTGAFASLLFRGVGVP